MIIEVNSIKLAIHRHDADSLRIPGTNYYLEPHTTRGDVAKASGLKTYDHALPHEWVKANFWDKGKDTPIGVWSYDNNRYGGEFVSLDDMLKMIAVAYFPHTVAASAESK